MSMVTQLAQANDVQQACKALSVPRASYYRWQNKKDQDLPKKARLQPPLSLLPEERQLVLDTLHSERFVDLAPGEVVSILLDEGQYICSERTMYRILAQAGELKERRAQRMKTSYAKPELLATGPNQVWSWDITKLRGPVKWSYYYLYVILDIFSRNVVGWLIADREASSIAKLLIEESCRKQGILKGQLTLHADRGASMKSKPVEFLLADLGVTKTHSRPYTSDDNPFSEAQFKTLKYCPEFPGKFGCIEDAKAFCRWFFKWYNEEHRHSGINRLTPNMVHYGQAKAVLEKRNTVLSQAFGKHAKRFKYRMPNAGELHECVWINPPRTATEQVADAA
jgi:putative transposase